MTKHFVLILLLLTTVSQLFAQSIKVSDDLSLYKVSDHCYVHNQKINNGLVYINNGEAIVVSTPESDIETQNLINWIKNEKHAKIVAYVIDRWHPDAMGGLKAVQKNNIKNYASKRTIRIAQKKKLPVPEIGFIRKKTIDVGGQKAICHFLGEAHTSDGIVVWIPDDKVLFGGNEIRNNKGWIGNIGNANIKKWSKTASNIKRKYGSAKIVIPGHGKYGGAKLIDYTIELYKLPNKKRNPQKLPSKLKTEKNCDFVSDSVSVNGNKQILKNAVFIAQDNYKFIEIESPEIIYKTQEQKINSETGRVRIYDKKGNNKKLRTDVDYKKLIVYKYDDTIGLVVVLKNIINNNR